MSEQPEAPDDDPYPVFDIADRLRKALREQSVSVADMASYLGVSRRTVSNWINGRIRPDTRTVRLWALRTGIPYGWLACHGDPRRPCALRPLPAAATAGGYDRSEGDSAQVFINMQRYLSRKPLAGVA